MKNSLQVSLGTGFGTLVAMLPRLSAGDFLKTILLAALGATVSFLVTLALQRLFRKR